MSFVSAAPEHLSYYDLQLDHPDWEHATVLDFGGNRGNALMAGRIKASNYWCIDVSRDAIEQGRRDYPEAHWIFYDRYNFRFNPTGIPGLPIPELGRKFDYVLAYSVFTHTHEAEMVELVGHLRKLVAEHGCLAFSFIDPHYVLPRNYSSLVRDHNPPTNLGLRLERSKLINPNLSVQQRLREAAGASWCALVDHDALYIGAEDTGGNGDKKAILYSTFCTAQYMSRIFPEGAILPPPQDYDTQQCDTQEVPMHHCCILQGSGGSATPAL